MRAIVWQGPNEMPVEEQPTPPDPGPGELILQPEAVGICGSEVEGYVGHMKNRIPPLVMGHEFAGTVVATGEVASSAPHPARTTAASRTDPRLIAAAGGAPAA